MIGLSAFGPNHGSGSGSANSTFSVWSNSAWAPVSFATNGTNPTYDWDSTRTVGVRLDSTDGSFATISYYIDGGYSGSWLYKTTARTLDTFSFYAQSNVLNAGFEFDNLGLYASALPGDANLDGKVDISDLGILATNWQTAGLWNGGDFTCDGLVDISDLGLLATNWQAAGAGQSFDQALAALGLQGASVPEPGAAGLAALCLLGATSRRRRRSRTQAIRANRR